MAEVNSRTRNKQVTSYNEESLSYFTQCLHLNSHKQRLFQQKRFFRGHRSCREFMSVSTQVRPSPPPFSPRAASPSPTMGSAPWPMPIAMGNGLQVPANPTRKNGPRMKGKKGSRNEAVVAVLPSHHESRITFEQFNPFPFFN